MRKFLMMYGDNNSGRNTIMRLFLNNNNVVSNISIPSPLVSAQYRDYSYFKDMFNFTYMDYLTLKAHEVPRKSSDVIRDYQNHIDHYSLNILNANSIIFNKDVVLAKSDLNEQHEKYIKFMEEYHSKTLYIKRNILVGIFTELDELFDEEPNNTIEKIVYKIRKEYDIIEDIQNDSLKYDLVIDHSDILTAANIIKEKISNLLDISFIPCTFRGYNKYLTNHEYKHIYNKSTFDKLKSLLIKYKISFKDISYEEVVYK